MQLTTLRLLCNRTVRGPDAPRPGEAWRALRALQVDERFASAPEPENLNVNLRAQRGARGHAHLWSDTYLAAFALTEGLTMASLDAGMKSLLPARTLLLQPSLGS